jgi:hypothetical protein
VRELLVEKMTQPRQLVGIAQLLRVDELVECRGEGAINRGLIGATATRI